MQRVRRTIKSREVKVLRGLSRDLLPAYVRLLSRDGVIYRDIGAALGVTESTVADLAAAGRPPVANQQVPEGFAGYLRSLRDERNPDLNALLAVAEKRGWTTAALGAALGISGQAVRARIVRSWGRGFTPAQARDTYIPTPRRSERQ